MDKKTAEIVRLSKAGRQTHEQRIATDPAYAAEAYAERARCKGILGHAEAVGREKMASHIAFNTGMSVEDAAGLLAASPKVETKTSDQGRPRDRLDSFLESREARRARGAAIVDEMFANKANNNE